MQKIITAFSFPYAWPLDRHPLSHAARHGLLQQFKRKCAAAFTAFKK